MFKTGERIILTGPIEPWLEIQDVIPLGSIGIITSIQESPVLWIRCVFPQCKDEPNKTGGIYKNSEYSWWVDPSYIKKYYKNYSLKGVLIDV